MQQPQREPSRNPVDDGVQRPQKQLPGIVLGLSVLVIGALYVSGRDPRVIIAPMLYAGAALGIGSFVRKILGASAVSAGGGIPLGAAWGIGFSFVLGLSHVLGMLGLLSVDRWWLALGVLIPGIALLAVSRVKPEASPGEGREARAWNRAGNVIFLAVCIASGVLLTLAVCIAPGWLWPSEFGAFDSLSYHLQLPKEWLATGRLWPVTNNVYSFLPGTMEAAYMHLMAVCGMPLGAPASFSRFESATMETGGIAANALHAVCAIAAAMSIGELARAMARRLGASHARQRDAQFAAQTLFVATPWVIVVGSISYNEMPMLLMFAAALWVAMSEDLRPGIRGLLVGWLVGSACMVKPTALLFVGVPCGIALLAWVPRRGWFAAIACGAAAGLLALMPYLVRNWLASGNPVFPYLHDVLGRGHWTAEQFARFASGHHFTGSWIERLRLLVQPDMNDPAGPRHRGLLHPQCAWIFPVTAIAITALLSRKDLRRALWVLPAIVLVQLVLWVGATHIQSRFLLPLLVPACAAVGAAFFGASWTREWIARGGMIVVAFASVWGAGYTLMQMRAALPVSPIGVMETGADAFHGLSLRTIDWGKESRDVRVKALSALGPTPFVNQLWHEGALGSGKVYLLGDSTPFYFAAPVLYHTTWDTSPIGAAIRDFPAEPRWWTRELRDRGVTSVLINFSELERLRRSGWYDPAVTPEALTPWVETLSPVRIWENLGVGLYLLPEPATDAT